MAIDEHQRHATKENSHVKELAMVHDKTINWTSKRSFFFESVSRERPLYALPIDWTCYLCSKCLYIHVVICMEVWLKKLLNSIEEKINKIPPCGSCMNINRTKIRFFETMLAYQVRIFLLCCQDGDLDPYQMRKYISNNVSSNFYFFFGFLFSEKIYILFR